MKSRSAKQIVALVIAVALGIGLFAFLHTTLAQAWSAENASIAATFPVIADFESGYPTGFVGFADSWDGSGSTTTLALNITTVDIPITPTIVGNSVVSVTYDVAASGGWGGGPGYAGVTHNFSSFQDWTGYQGLGFWFYGANTGNPMRVEIKTDGDTGEGGSNRFVWSFADDFSGWKYFRIPWASFVKRTDYNPGAALGDAINLAKMWGYSVLLPGGVSGTFYMDQVELVGLSTEYDFESGYPTDFVGFADSWDGSGSLTTLALNITAVDIPITPTIVGNSVVSVTYDVAASGGWGGGPGYAGVTHDFSPSQDWTAYQGLGFWFYGLNTGNPMRVELKTDGDAGAGGSNRFVWSFADDFSGWKYFRIPWASFVKRTDYNPGAALGDAINLAKMWGYSILLPGGVSGTFYMDQVAAYGGSSAGLSVAFEDSKYRASEDAGTASVTVTLSAISPSTITVDYATADGTATASSDYVTASGTLTFTPGTTAQVFDVLITADTAYELNETVILSLTNATNASIGTINPATLIITNDDTPPDALTIDDFEEGIFIGENHFGTGIGFSNWGRNYPDEYPVFTTTTVLTGTALAVPGQGATNVVLSVTYDIQAGGWGGITRAFEDGNDEWTSQDWSRYDGIRFWYYGVNTGETIYMEVFDNMALHSTGDSAERFETSFVDNFSGWKQFSIPFSDFSRRTSYQPAGAPADGSNLTNVSGYAFHCPIDVGQQTIYIDQVEIYGDLSTSPKVVRAEFSAYAYGVPEGQDMDVRVMLNTTSATTVTLTYTYTESTATAGADYSGTPVVSGTLTFAPGDTVESFTVQTIDDGQDEADETIDLALSDIDGAALGWKSEATLYIQDDDIVDPALIDDFEDGVPLGLTPSNGVTVTTVGIDSSSAMAVPGQYPLNTVLSVTYSLPTLSGGFTRAFATSQDWSDYAGYSFWYYGSNTGKTMTVQILDNRAPDPGPSGWALAWSDEFDGPAGAPPDSTKWGYDIGGSGWGNQEWQYYTDSTDNAAMNGSGSLIITATTENTATTSYMCAHTPPSHTPGPCAYTSARLLTQDKFEFAHGRAEARIKLPEGQGIWPAFWMLGGNFDKVGWPDSGEIDIMEFLGHDPTTTYGTVHGPGYSGGGGVGSSYTQTLPLTDTYHVFAIEWEPDVIRWYVDSTNFFTVTPDAIPAGTEWVFDHPFFLIMNIAVGGYWPGYPDATTQFPQTMEVDYVRVYQAPDTAERFETTFVDNFAEWRKVTIPFGWFTRSATQPIGAPNDGLTLTEMWGYGIQIPSGGSGSFYMDDVERTKTILYFSVVMKN